MLQISKTFSPKHQKSAKMCENVLHVLSFVLGDLETHMGHQEIGHISRRLVILSSI